MGCVCVYLQKMEYTGTRERETRINQLKDTLGIMTSDLKDNFLF